MLLTGIRRIVLVAWAAALWAGLPAPSLVPAGQGSAPGFEVRFPAALAKDAGFTGRVVRVTDGDTVVVRSGDRDERIRLLGIDAPEHKQAPWGPRAAEFVRKLASGKAARVETDVQTRDRYGRLLGYLYVDGKFVNLEIVRQGYAMLYTSPPNVAHSEEFLAAQREAREAGRNIWSPSDGLTETPYEYRHNRPAPRSIGQGGLPNHRKQEGRSGGRSSGRGNSADVSAEGRSAAASGPGGSAGLSEPAPGGAGSIGSVVAQSPFVGNRRSRKFHAGTCPLAATIAVSNRIGYASVEDAKAAGMVPCRSCGGKAR